LFLSVHLGLVGEGGVGTKSALIAMFLRKTFLECYDPTIEDIIYWNTTLDNIQYKVQFIDTSGQEEFQAVRRGSLSKCDGFLVGYDITNRNSFISAFKLFLREIKKEQRKKLQKIPIVVIGNKIDLEVNRQVAINEGRALAARIGHPNNFYETSVKNNYNVSESIFQLLREVTKYKMQKKAKYGSSQNLNTVS